MSTEPHDESQPEAADHSGVGEPFGSSDLGSDLHRLRGDLRLLEQALRNDWGSDKQQIDTAVFAEQLAMEAAAQKQVTEAMTKEERQRAPYKHEDRIRMAGLRVAVQLRAQKIRLLELLLKKQELAILAKQTTQPTNLMQMVVKIEQEKRANVMTREGIYEAIERAAAEQAAEESTQYPPGSGNGKPPSKNGETTDEQ